MAKPGFAWIWEKGWEPLLPPLGAAIHSCHSWVLKCSAPTAICSVALMSTPGSEPCPCEGVCPRWAHLWLLVSGQGWRAQTKAQELHLKHQKMLFYWASLREVVESSALEIFKAEVEAVLSSCGWPCWEGSVLGDLQRPLLPSALP